MLPEWPNRSGPVRARLVDGVGTHDLGANSALAGLAFERAPFGISLESARAESFGRYAVMNPAYCEMTGFGPDELGVRTFQDLVHPDDLDGVIEVLRSLSAGVLDASNSELRLRRRDDSIILVRQLCSLIRDPAGEPRFFLTHTKNISQLKLDEAEAIAARRAAEAALRESEARYRLLAEYAADMIVCTRADRTRSFVSPGSRTVLGFEPSEIIECDFATFLHPDDRERVSAEYDRFLRDGGRETHAYRLRHKSGSYVWVEAHWVAMRDETATGSGSVVVSVVRDISERKIAEAKIASLASHDSLTGLPNRVLFQERLQQALTFVRSGESAAVLSIDLDHFKPVNDTLGHSVGDSLLQAVAKRLIGCMRASDTVARIGGDEFAVVLLGLKVAADAARSAQRIVDALSKPYDLDGQQVTISASVGITTSPADGTDADTLLKKADVALYCAKAEGRCAYRMFDPEMDVRLRARRDMERELREALANEAFTVFYQPIVNLKSKAIVTLEALVRWLSGSCANRAERQRNGRRTLGSP